MGKLVFCYMYLLNIACILGSVAAAIGVCGKI